MKSRPLLVMIALATVTLIAWRVLPHVRPARVAADADDNVPIVPSSRVKLVNGEAVITLDAQTQAGNGIRVAALGAAAAPPQTSAPAAVLSVAPLVAACDQLANDRTALAKAQAAVVVDQQEYQRLQHLYQQQQNASAREVEAAHGTLAAAQADVVGTQQRITLDIAAVRAAWGDPVARWVQDGGVQLTSLLAHGTVLVQVTLPPGTRQAPTAISLEALGTRVAAHYVSTYPQADPRLQGLSLLYLAPARDGLVPGLNLAAWLPQGKPAPGVLVPQTAIIWWQGAAWTYERTSPTTFVRRPVPDAQPLPGGLFAATGFKRGEYVVVQGGAALLSEELRAQIQPED